MKRHPLVEVFGYPTDNHSADATAHRAGKLCPYNNKVPRCTKNSLTDPLGVCTLKEGASETIICPVRFRQDWVIAADAARFFFPPGTRYSWVTEVRLADSSGQSAGNIDVVVVALSGSRIVDFGSLEIQGVYISGNLTNPFEAYMANAEPRPEIDWRGQPLYPRPDYLSSSRKRLAPQLLFKGGILKAWNKKQAVAVHENFMRTLPPLPQVPRESADIAWFIYGLDLNAETNQYKLVLRDTIYTAFDEALLAITKSEPGSPSTFMSRLQAKFEGRSTEGVSLFDVVITDP